MTNLDVACLYCKGRMELGYIPDFSHTAIMRPAWVEGEPEKSVWRGLTLKDKRQIHVRSFRCTQCGFLASFARETGG